MVAFSAVETLDTFQHDYKKVLFRKLIIMKLTVHSGIARILLFNASKLSQPERTGFYRIKTDSVIRRLRFTDCNL